MKSRNRNPIQNAVNLATAIAATQAQIERLADTAAQRVVGHFSTRTQAEYERAAAQAEKLLAEVDPDNPAEAYPALEVDVEIGTIDPRTASAVTTLRQAAEVITLTRDGYFASLDQIRVARKTAKAAAATAANITELETILAGLAWPA